MICASLVPSSLVSFLVTLLTPPTQAVFARLLLVQSPCSKVSLKLTGLFENNDPVDYSGLFFFF